MISVQKPYIPNQGTRVPHRKASLRPDSDLLTRTSWADASLALVQIKKGKATGNKRSLDLRAWIQKHLLTLGCFIQRNPGPILCVAVVLCICMCVSLNSCVVESNVEKLWVEAGGRLEEELKYTKDTLREEIGGRELMIIHTPKEKGGNVLHPDTLLAHQQMLKAALQVSVEVFDIQWSLKDMCATYSFPQSELHYIDMTLENLSPCVIITPLDCFWEGSKLLGPDYPVKIPGMSLSVQWTNLNPQLLIDTVKSLRNYASTFPFHKMESFMKRAGITTAYQEKPCLNPKDEHCPATASNKKSSRPLGIGAELTGGCSGFAKKYMHWPEAALVGGITKNRTGHIIRAEALQTTVLLMSDKEMTLYWQNHIKVHNLDWNEDKAKKVLEAFRRKMTETIFEEANSPSLSARNKVYVFSGTSLDDIMKNFSKINFRRIGIGLFALLAYICFMKCSDPVNSQCFSGVGGVILIAVSVADGLGFLSFLAFFFDTSAFVFNAVTTQVVPFIALALGVNNMFLIIHQYKQSVKSESISKENLIGEVIKRVGVNIILTSVSKICACCVAGYIPIPSMKVAACQIGLLVAFSAGTILFIFPAWLSYDMKRRSSWKFDLLSCFKWCDFSENITTDKHDRPYRPLSQSQSNSSVSIPIRQAVTHALPPDGRNIVTVLVPSGNQHEDTWPHIGTPASSFENISINIPSKDPPSNKMFYEKAVEKTKQCQNWSILTWLLSQHLAPALQRTPIKLVVIILCMAMMFLGVWGIYRVEDGFDLTDIVPRNTNEYEFLSQRTKYFKFFNMYAVTKGNFKYPTNQRLLYDYHEAFSGIDKIIKNDNGEPPEFWLTRLKSWLNGLQKEFDEHKDKGCITPEGWCQNATDDSIMAYKLMVQTGRTDNPVDKSLVKTGRLVDEDGIINTKAFYNYLSAWVSNDALAYSASQANFVPKPKPWHHDPQDVELKMPKSQPLVYAQMPFLLDGLGTTEEITSTIREVRAVCEKFRYKGLPNFPSGQPFTYWEPFINLRYYLTMCLLVIFVVIFFVIGILLCNAWAAAVVIAFLFVITVELFGYMGIMGIKLNAITAAILIMSVGVGVDFIVHLLMGFLTSIGSREHRVGVALEQMSPVLHGGVSTLICVIMLAFSEFDFIFRYFFTVLCALVVIGLLNGFIVFPVLLSLIGPPGEVVPYDDPERIPTPSPEPSPVRLRMKRARPFTRRIYPRVPSEISLSTITEESASCHSHEIVVEPELVVETTTVTNTTTGASTVNTTTSSPETPDSQSEDSSKCNTPCGENISTTTSSTSNIANQPSGTTTVTTRVKATAKVKVEVHAPYSSNTDISRHRRRRDSSSSRSSSARSSPT